MASSLSELQFSFSGGPLDGKKMDINFQKITLGRDLNCDLTVDDPKLSRKHCYFQVEGDEIFVYDLGSTNGTFVNGRAIMRERIDVDDVVTVGLTDISLRHHEEFNTINFSASDTIVTSEVKTKKDSTSDALADQFKNIFDFYKDYQPDMSEVEKVELVKTQRLLNSMQTLQSVAAQMSKLLPADELLRLVAQGLFDVFAGAENLVILMQVENDPDKFRPVYARDKSGDEQPQITISSTVLKQAVENRSTLVANDIGHDSALNVQESLVRFDVKSVICSPLVSGEKVLGALYLDNRQQNIHYDQMDAELVTVFANQAAIAIENALLCDSLQNSYVQTLQSLVSAIEAKDKYTRGHSGRVKKYAQAIAKMLDVPDQMVERLGVAAELHDIGKIGVSERIINKPGDLTDDEYKDIKNHVDMGVKILEPIQHLKDVMPWIHGHHERWDGKGYPRGLKQHENPLGGRILAVADAFDAMTSQRAYNKPMSFMDAATKIKSEKGSAFDPHCADAMIEWIHKLETQKDDESEENRFQVAKTVESSEDDVLPDRATDISDFS